jgi:hypothetical protein
MPVSSTLELPNVCYYSGSTDGKNFPTVMPDSTLAKILTVLYKNLYYHCRYMFSIPVFCNITG